MDEDSAEKREHVFSTAIYFTAVTGLCLLTAAWMFDSPVSHALTNGGSYEYLVRLLFLILLCDSLVIYPTLVLRAENRLVYYSVIACSRFFLFIILNLVLVWRMGRGLRGVFEANLTCVLILVVLLVPIYRKYLRGTASLSVLRRMLFFGIPTIFTLLSMRLIDYSDRLLILYLRGANAAEELGGYSVAYSLGMVGVMVFVHSFRIAWQPFFLSLKDDTGATNIFSRVTTYYAVIIGMVFLGIALFRNELFPLYASPKYPLSLAHVVPFVSFAYIFFGFYIIMLAGIFIREKTKYLPVVTFTAAAINIGLNFVFIPAFGVIGAAYTTIIAYIVMVILMYIISSRVYHVTYEFRRLGSVLLLTAAPIALMTAYLPENGILSFLYRIVLFLVPPIVYLAGDFLLPEERAGLKRFLSRTH